MLRGARLRDSSAVSEFAPPCGGVARRAKLGFANICGEPETGNKRSHFCDTIALSGDRGMRVMRGAIRTPAMNPHSPSGAPKLGAPPGAPLSRNDWIAWVTPNATFFDVFVFS